MVEWPPPEWVGENRKQPWGPLDRFDRASPAVDCVLLTVERGSLKVLLHRRTEIPHEGEWALPGSFVDYGKRYEDTVKAALKRKCGVSMPAYCEPIESWNPPDRDKRGWVITVVFLALAPAANLRRSVGPTSKKVTLAALEVPWAGQVPGDIAVSVDGERFDKLAFDHDELIARAVARFRRELTHNLGLILELMPDLFTLPELQRVYEAVIGREVNEPSFRRSVTTARGLVEPTGQYHATFGRKAAELYRCIEG